MPQLSTADHQFTPPRVTVPRDYNAAWDLIQRNLQAGRGNKAAFIDDAGSYTYGELAERVNRFGNVLADLGIGAESRVMLCLLDTVDFPTAFLGSIQAGVVPIAANTLLTASDYDFMLGDSRARALVVPPRRCGRSSKASSASTSISSTSSSRARTPRGSCTSPT